MEGRRFLARVVLGLWAIRPTDAGQDPAIDLFWSVPEQLELKLPPAGRRAVEEEVLAIYWEIGIEVNFPTAPSSDDEGAHPAFHIVLIDRSGTGFGVAGQAMGAILQKDPAQHTVFVFLPVVLKALRNTVGKNTKMIHDARKGQVFARALGRVVAHEIAHAIDRDLPHGPKDSLMSELLTPRMLQQHRLAFDETTGERIRERIIRFRRERAPPDPWPPPPGCRNPLRN